MQQKERRAEGDRQQGKELNSKSRIAEKCDKSDSTLWDYLSAVYCRSLSLAHAGRSVVRDSLYVHKHSEIKTNLHIVD